MTMHPGRKPTQVLSIQNETDNKTIAIPEKEIVSHQLVWI